MGEKSWQIFAPVTPSQEASFLLPCYEPSCKLLVKLWFGRPLPATCLDLTLLGLAENNYYNHSHLVEFYIPSFTCRAFHPLSENKHAYYETTLILKRIKQLTRHWAPLPENSGSFKDCEINSHNQQRVWENPFKMTGKKKNKLRSGRMSLQIYHWRQI